MNAHSLRASWAAWRESSGLGMVSIGLFLAMLVFVLGNALAVCSQVVRYEGSIRQITTLGEVRMLSQRLAVQAMRLSDGSLAQTAGLSRNLDAMERALVALDRGGVVAGRDIPPLASAGARSFLPRIQDHWQALRDRLRDVLLQSYGTAGLDSLSPEAAGKARALRRQWIAEDATSLLDVLTATSDVLVPRLHAEGRQAVMMGVGLAVLDLLILMLVFLWLQRHLVQPLHELRQAAQDWIGGRYATRVRVQGVGELRDVARAFNAGADQLHTLMNRVREEQAGLERSGIIFQGLALNSLVGIFLAESDRFSFVSEKMAEIFGYEVAEMTASMPLLSIIVPRERYLVSEAIKASEARRDGTLRFERHGRCKDGTVIDIEVFGTAIQVDGKVSIIGLVQDVTERKLAESSAQLAAIAYENSSEAIAITDASGIIVNVNPAYSRMTGYWPDEVAGEMLPLLRPGRHNRDFYDQMWHAINTTGRWEGEYWGHRKSGEEYAERVIMDTAWNHDGSVNCRVVMLGDVTQKKQVEAQIWSQAHHDPLTSLPNRQYFNERLQAAVVAADRAQGSLALLFLDLDLFKEVNDSMGHAVGDQLLVEVARRLSACGPSGMCFVARLGGDEFVMIARGAGERAEVDALCEEVLDCINQPYLVGDKTLRISASLGVALYPRDAQDAEALLRNVDMAMYEAKEARHNGYQYFDARMGERVRIRRDLLYALPQAIEAGQFFLLYQPIYEFGAGTIDRAEILLRWRHPDLGIVSPMDFIPFAEERHLIRPLSDWVFGQAARQLAEWRALSPRLRLTMNVSPGQLAEDGVDLQALLALLKSYGLPSDALSLECCGDLFLDMDDEAGGRLRAMSAAGMHFSVGAVSLGMSALLAMPSRTFDTLKLERAATGQLLSSEQAMAVCESLIALAHRLGLSVVAEGVTTRDQYELLSRMGCDAGQGYWFDEPLEREVFEQRLREGARRP